MFWAVKLESFNKAALWNRLKVIAVEDVGVAHSSMPILIDVLEKQYFKAIDEKDDSSRLFLATTYVMAKYEFLVHKTEVLPSCLLM